MKNPKVAARYAKSLKDLAKEQGKLDECHSDMELILNACKESKDFDRLLMSPVINTDKKLAILREILSGKISELSMAFVEIITRKRREMLLESIAEAFILLYNHFKDIHTATITTATPLTDELREAVKNVIKKEQNGEIQLEEHVDEDLIGGFVLRLGDKQFNASIRQKLYDLEQEFSKNTYQRKI